MDKKIKDLAADLNANGVKLGKKWNGFTVYEPIYDKNLYIGLPYVILEKEGVLRISSDSEALEYLDFAND